LSKFAGRRKTKEWNLIGALFSAAKAERYDLVNRLCEPEDLNGEVDALMEVLLSRSAETVTCTKYFVDKGADLHMAESLVFEGAPDRHTSFEGIRAFADKESRDQRRKLAMNFWQD
jgi:enoyl-CoA hydratase/carnithine racemase